MAISNCVANVFLYVQKVSDVLVTNRWHGFNITYFYFLAKYHWPTIRPQHRQSRHRPIIYRKKSTSPYTKVPMSHMAEKCPGTNKKFMSLPCDTPLFVGLNNDLSPIPPLGPGMLKDHAYTGAKYMYSCIYTSISFVTVGVLSLLL